MQFEDDGPNGNLGLIERDASDLWLMLPRNGLDV
jgi:hypothetical protein